MSLLHTVSRSPLGHDALEGCLGRALPGSALLLLEDGVLAAARGTAAEPALRDACARLRVYALGPDLEARGIAADRLVEGVEVVDYPGFVDLVAAHHAVQAWR